MVEQKKKKNEPVKITGSIDMNVMMMVLQRMKKNKEEIIRTIVSLREDNEKERQKEREENERRRQKEREESERWRESLREKGRKEREENEKQMQKYREENQKWRESMREDFEKQRQKYREKDQKRRESLRKETNANYETVNEKIEESKIDKDREAEIMEEQVEGLQEENNTGPETIEEKTVETKQNIANRLDRPRKTNREYTKEIIEMTQGGLINILNPPVTDRRERSYMKEYKKNLMKRDKRKECITKKIIGQNAFKVSVPVSYTHLDVYKRQP